MSAKTLENPTRSELERELATPPARTDGSTEPPLPPTRERGRRGPIKITVNLLAKALAKLEQVCDLTGESRTDAINRAIQWYALYHESVEKGESFRIVSKDGTQREVQLL